MNQSAVAVHSYFRGRLIDVQVLDPPGAGAPGHRRARHRRRGQTRVRGAESYRIGWGKGVDAPVGAAFIGGGDDHALVTVDERGAALHVTSRMVGRVRRPEGAQTLATLLPGGAGELALAADAHAEVSCGAMTFRIDSAPSDTIADVPPPPALRWGEQRYTLGVAVATLLVLVMLASVPPDRNALSLDFDTIDGHRAKVRINAKEFPPVTGDTVAGGAGAAKSAPSGGASDPGRAGTPDATKRPRPQKLLVKGTSNRTELAEAPNPVNLVNLISQSRSASVRSIFTRGTAFGDAADNVLGTLVASGGLDWGNGGFDLRGTGTRGAGTGEGMIPGVAHLPTIGLGHDPGGGPGTGTITGTRLPPHKTIFPEIVPGKIDARGIHDKEIVRRIIRLHLNEVRYCYEQELPRHPNLSGRLAVQFVITANGQVVSSAVQESTLHINSLENCVTQAVRRWPFPQAQGGGLTIVTYPFVLSPAGA